MSVPISIFKLLYWNLGLVGTWTASSSFAALPPSNLGQANRGLPWRSLTSVNQWIKVQLAAGGAFAMGSQVGGPDQLGGASEATAVQGAALIDSNLTTAATVHLQGHWSDDWTNPVVDQVVTLWDTSRRGVLPVFLAAPQLLPWWRWTFDDPGNPTGVIQIGVAPLGPVLTWEDEPGVASSVGIDIGVRLIDPSLRSTAPSGTPYRFQLPRRFAIDLPTGVLRESWVFDTLWPVLERVGLSTDMVACQYASDPSGTGGAEGFARTTNLYGAFDGTLAMAALPPYWRGSLTLVESK